MKYVLLVLIFILLTSSVVAVENTVPLLAVSELENGSLVGGTADLTIEIVEGKGRVFIDTFPLTKVDTQVSTRIAKEIACDFIDVDCSEFDIIYTIDSGSSIVGGPSAGAAVSVITILTLLGESPNSDVAITGTINTGGLVGQVGGVKQKIDAAYRSGISTVLIPYSEVDLEEMFANQTNSSDLLSSQELVEYGEELGIKVVEVSTLDQILMYFTDWKVEQRDLDITAQPFYIEKMKSLADDICQQTNLIISELDFTFNEDGVSGRFSNGVLELSSNQTVFENSSIDVNSTYTQMIFLRNQSTIAIERGDYYSGASFCYGAGLNARFLSFIPKPVSVIESEFERMKDDELVSSDYSTIVQLQTYILVQERYKESLRHEESAIELLELNRTMDAKNLYSLAIGRMYSAKAWSQFFEEEGEILHLDRQTLSQSCSLVIREAEQRFNYVSLYVPFVSGFSELERAKELARTGEYESCLFEASKAKASMDVILGTVGVSELGYNRLIEDRISIVTSVIADQIDAGVFPIIGYSYLEYAQSLIESDPSSSLLYLQYALELSRLDLYFESDTQSVTLYSGNLSKQTEYINPLLLLLIGFCFGVIGSWWMLRR